MDARESNVITIISAFAIGGLIGAAVALLIAPHSGMETRQLIRDKSVELKDKAVARVGDTREKAKGTLEDIAHKTRESASSIRRKGEEVVESATRK